MTVNGAEQRTDENVAEEAARYHRQDRPDFTFVYLGTVDIAGHNHGWMSAGYLDQVLRVDAVIGTLIDSLSDDATCTGIERPRRSRSHTWD